MTVSSTDTPLPDHSGSTGGQESESGNPLPPAPQGGLPVVDGIVTGISANPKALGATASALLIGAAHQLEFENKELRQEKRDLRTSLDDSQNQIANERVRSAELKTQLNSEIGNRHPRNILITLGTTLAVSSDVFPDFLNTGSNSLWFLGIGALIVIEAWFSPIKRIFKGGNWN